MDSRKSTTHCPRSTSELSLAPRLCVWRSQTPVIHVLENAGPRARVAVSCLDRPVNSQCPDSSSALPPTTRNRKRVGTRDPAMNCRCSGRTPAGWGSAVSTSTPSLPTIGLPSCYVLILAHSLTPAHLLCLLCLVNALSCWISYGQSLCLLCLLCS